MTFRSTSLLLLSLLFVIPAVGQDDTRVSATWQVQKYDIAATVPQSETDRNLAVKAKVEARNASARPASTMTLRISPAADISAVTINGTASEFSKREEKTGTGSLQQIVVRMPSVAPSGTVAVEVTYRLNVKDNSGLAAISSTGSQFLPLSYWYPTPNSWFFARGADYAPTRIQVTAPSGLTAVASGSEAGGAFDGK